MSKKNHYQILDVSMDANGDTIKKAYRKQAFMHHPDKNPDEIDAKERFNEISEAYHVLKDPQKRTAYNLRLLSETLNISPKGFGGGRSNTRHENDSENVNHHETTERNRDDQLYENVIVETYVNCGEPAHAKIRCRPLHGQGHGAGVKVQCSRAMRRKLGAGKLIRMKLRKRRFPSGNYCLFTPPNASYEVISPKEADQFLNKK
jgi:curved DNA-binding protein CbpA